jgi:DNA-binding HxlR family transcriptional regulator
MDQNCACYVHKVSIVTEIFQRKWTLHILCAMQRHPVRLGELTRLIPGASKKALRAALRDLESAQIITRRDLSGLMLHVEYDFAESMRETICGLLDQLAEWGDVIRPTDGEPR